MSRALLIAAMIFSLWPIAAFAVIGVTTDTTDTTSLAPAGKPSDYSEQEFNCRRYDDEVVEADRRAAAAKRQAERTRDPSDIESANQLADEYNRLLEERCEGTP